MVAEKFQALVRLGMATSRMKALYDLWILAQHGTFSAPLLSQAIGQTFQHRQTPLPTQLPLALSAEFAQDPTKHRQWQAFLRQGRLAVEGLEWG